MTAVEQQTVIKLSQQLADFIEEDKQWKEEVTKQLKPILQERFDREIVSRYGRSAWKVLVTIVGFIATLGVIYNYLIRPFISHIK